MKKRIFKIMFWISLLPYVILLVMGIWHAFFGFTFFSATYTGWEGFVNSVFILGWACCVIYPVLPVCLLYQMIFLIYMIAKRWKKNREKQED